MYGTSVVMFPGLGAHYPRMIEKFVDAYPDARVALAEWSELIDCQLGGHKPTDPRERERRQQIEIHALSLLWWRYVSARIPAPAVCGHSLGYYAAMVAAGVLSEADSLRLIDAVFAVGWRHFGHSDDPVFVVTTKKEYDFARLAHEVPIEVLSENNPLQRVLHGSRAQYEEVMRRLNGTLLGAIELGTRVPFHSMRMKTARQEMQQAIDALAIKPGALRLQLWSHISARPLLSAADALDLVFAQPYQTVRWQLLVDRLLQAGRFEFIEVGPNRILSQLVRWTSPKLEVRFVDNLRR